MKLTRLAFLVLALTSAAWGAAPARQGDAVASPAAEAPPPAGAAGAASAAPPPPASPAPPPSAPPAEAAPEGPKPKLVLSQWQSLYLAQRKIGYIAQDLSDFPDGGHRLETNLFLASPKRPDKFGYYRVTTADVDARYRPRALMCRVATDDRSWEVKGRTEGGALVLTRTVGKKSAAARIPLDDDATFLSWTLPATLRTTAQGETKRWAAIDESLGAVLPDHCLVHVLGPRTIPAEPGGQPLSGTCVAWACGPEQVAHLLAGDGRILRSLWQSAPLVGQAAGLLDAQRLRASDDGPPGPAIEGFDGRRYTDARRGFSIGVPPYPFIVHASPASGSVAIADLTDEASVMAQMVFLPRPASAVAAESDAGRLAELLQHGWAARFEDVQAGPGVPEKIADQPARLIEGTARLGCTTFFFRNYFLTCDGRAYFLSVVAADRPISSEPVLASDVVRSLRLSLPEGPLPMQVSGDVLRSPYYGFELRRPSTRWIIPQHVDGPLAVLELARQDHAAVAMIRLLKPRPDQSLADFAKDQAQLAADNLNVAKPEPKAVLLDGRPAYEIAYEAKRVLSERSGRCTAVYTKMGGQVLALVLIAATDADPSAARELQEIRESLKFAEQPASK
jgi:hypothetical protein